MCCTTASATSPIVIDLGLDSLERLEIANALEETFGEESVLKPGFFSALSIGSMGQSLEYSEIDGVDTPGVRFHEDVAKLSEGETGIASNDPGTVVFLVRIVRDMVFNEFRNVTGQVAELAQVDRIKACKDWLDDTAREFEVEWQDPK